MTPRRRALLLAHLALAVLALALHARLLLGEVHAGWDVTATRTPWARPVPVWNPLLEDPVVWELPHAWQQEHDGHPSWNPLVGLGGQAGTFTAPPHGYGPSALAHALLPAWLARDVVALLHLLLAGALSLRWLVWRGHGVRAALAGAIAWQLSTQNMVWLEHAHRLALAAWAPLALWAAERAARRLRAADGARLAGALGLAILADLSDQCTALLCAACGALVVLGAAPGRRGRGLVLVALAGLGGAALAGVRVVPMLLELAEGNRARAGLDGWFERSAMLEPRHLLLALVPDLLGGPLRSFELLAVPGQLYANYSELRLHVGLPVLALALAGLSRRARTAPFAGLALLAVLVAFPTPLAWLPGALIPGFTASSPTRALWLAHALLPPLVAAGAGRALRGGPGPTRAALVVLAGVVAVALACGRPAGAEALIPDRWALSGEQRRAMAKDLAGRLDLGSSRAVERRSGEGRSGWLLSPTLGPMLLAGAAAAALLASRARGRRRLALSLLVGLEALDLLSLGLAYNPTSRPADLFRPTAQLARAIERAGPHGRLLGEGLLPNLLQPLGARELGAYGALFPGRVTALLEAIARPPRMPQVIQPVELPAAWRDLLGVRVVLTPAGAAPSAPSGLVADAGAPPGPVAVWLDPGAGPRARLFPPAAVVRRAERAAALEALRAPGFDPRREVVFEAPEGAGAGAVDAPPGAVRFAEDGAERVSLDVEAPGGGLLVLADAWARGWSVTVEGVDAPTAGPADVALRGVELPAGFRGRVTWSYARPGRHEGRAATLAAALGLLVVAQRRRKAAAWPVAIT